MAPLPNVGVTDEDWPALGLLGPLHPTWPMLIVSEDLGDEVDTGHLPETSLLKHGYQSHPAKLLLQLAACGRVQQVHDDYQEIRYSQPTEEGWSHLQLEFDTWPEDTELLGLLEAVGAQANQVTWSGESPAFDAWANRHDLVVTPLVRDQ